MSCTDFAHPVATATRPEDSTVFVALELSRKSWLVATSSPGEERISKRVVTAGDGAGAAWQAARDGGAAAGPGGAGGCDPGMDGFWVHRLLVDNAIESHVPRRWRWTGASGAGMRSMRKA